MPALLPMRLDEGVLLMVLCWLLSLPAEDWDDLVGDLWDFLLSVVETTETDAVSDWPPFLAMNFSSSVICLEDAPGLFGVDVLLRLELTFEVVFLMEGCLLPALEPPDWFTDSFRSALLAFLSVTISTGSCSTAGDGSTMSADTAKAFCGISGVELSLTLAERFVKLNRGLIGIILAKGFAAKSVKKFAKEFWLQHKQRQDEKAGHSVRQTLQLETYLFLE